jgi:hypothetical protein
LTLRAIMYLLLNSESEHMVDHHSSKHDELSEQLTGWWRAQTDFRTKKELAAFLRVHPDTLGDYFPGRKFPKSEIANRLYELTKIPCLEPHSEAASTSETAPQDSSIFATSSKDSPEPGISSASGLSEDKYRSGKSLKAKPRQPSSEIKEGERHGERPVVISLQRTSCPFCMQGIFKFRSCGHCGQSFVWANIPMT